MNNPGYDRDESKFKRSPMPLRSLTLALLAVVCFQSILAAAKSPPNIVFILIDDLGWMDLA